MTITHHLDDATLMSFAAGSLPNALAAVAAAHVAMCPHCRRELRMLERIGGALVSALRRRPWTLAAGHAGDHRPACTCSDYGGRTRAISLAIIGGGLDEVRWRWSDRGCGIVR